MHARTPRRRYTLAALTAIALLTLVGCAGPQPAAPVSSDPGFGHVHGVDVNPADGLVYAANHHGVFRLAHGGPERIADRYQDTMGFTIAGPDHFLASGHPDPREPGPAHLGLIVSTDAARTWTPVSLHGKADLHALTATGATVYGWNSRDGAVLRSDDSGRTWQRGATLSTAALAVDPDNPMQILATTADALVESLDGGISFTPTATQPPARLVLIDNAPRTGGGGEATFAGIDATGTVWTADASGWTRAGSLDAAPEAFAVAGVDRYLAATASGVHTSEDGGRTWTRVAAAR
jgi:hypothetical protein